MALKRFESSGVMGLRLNEERQVDKIKDPIANKCGGGGIDQLRLIQLFRVNQHSGGEERSIT